VLIVSHALAGAGLEECITNRFSAKVEYARREVDVLELDGVNLRLQDRL